MTLKRSPMPPRKAGLKATTIKASAKRMRQSRSTGTPAKAQSSRFDAMKRGECMACRINDTRLHARCDGEGCDAHHLLSGGRRRGHDFTIALCAWHHRAIRPDDCRTDAEAFHKYGPTVANELRMFRETYGSDDALLAIQNEQGEV
jgi:hypothetical protein